ncbi:MAG: hypothetical protein KC729_17680, partial [Candidatus Eisenbacteria bacterium]|nr:hypothetical protein [Candidatus Eisenbacteria bacterium]
MIVRSAIVPSRRNTPCSLILGLLLAAGISAPVFAATLSVQVLDGRDGAPLDGAYVQVGPAPGVPFAGNIDFTDTNGMVTFDDPAITGPQTVTAAADGFARLSLLDAVTGSVVVRLSRETPQGGIYGPSAEISGTVTGIATTNNDGNFDIGFVYPAVQLIDLLRQNLDIEIPADTVNFPVVGDVVIPGNVVVPNQIEFLIFNFSKPLYHFFIGDGSTYDFVSLAARIPTSALQLPLDEAINQAVMREIGIERQIPVSGNQVLNINSDIDLTRNLTVNVPEAPNGTTIQVAAVADVPNPSGVRTIYFDLKTGLRDAGGSFLLSGRNPTGDLSDAVPYLAGSYGDSSTADAFSAGRVDRSSLVLPATRTLGDFFLLPDLTQNGAQYEWSDVARPGITPDPTWAMGSFRLEPVTPGDGSVTTQNLWDVWSVADAFALTLPTLSGAAPGGIPDVGGTAEDDQIV